jgi:hypothetical protein
MMAEGKRALLFLQKKKQKNSSLSWALAMQVPHTTGIKSFLLLFFKKEDLAPSLTSPLL